MAKKKSSSQPKKSVAERISDVAQRWFLIDPLLFAAYCTHATEENLQLHVPMRCGKGKVEYNPTLLEEVSDEELADRLKVETMRILLKHPYQRQPYRARPEILYLASNMTILDSMGGPYRFSFELVPQELINALPSGKTFEEYYGLLNRMFPPELVTSLTIEINIQLGGVGLGQGQRKDNDHGQRQNQENSGQDQDQGNDGKGKGEGNDNDNTGKEGIKPNSKDTGNGGTQKSSKAEDKSYGINFSLAIEAAETWEEDGIMAIDINLRITATLAGGKGRGTLPASFIETVEASLVPAINVANLLKNFKKSILCQQRNLTRMRPSRRYGFEQMGSRYAYITKVLVAIDVSGSVDSFTLSYMLGMVNRIYRQGIAQIDVVQFDAELKLPVKPLAKAIKSYEVLGRGGTDFQPAADFYLKHTEYDGLIYITDGLAPNPIIPIESKFSRPVVWIITDDDLVPTIQHGWDRK